MAGEYLPAFRHDAIGRMAGKRRALITTKLPQLMFPGEQAVFVGRVERETDEIAYVALTNYRLLATTKDIFPVVQVQLADIEAFKVGMFNNVEVTVNGRQVKLGNITNEKDIPRLKYFLGQIAGQDTIYDTINRIITEVSVGVANPVAIPPTAQPGRPPLGSVPPTIRPTPTAVKPLVDAAPDAFGHLTELDRADIEAKLINLLNVGERVACAAKVVLFEVSQPGWVVITSYRLVAFTNEMHLVLDVPLADVSAFEARQNDLLSITVDGEPLMIGLLETQGDAWRVGRTLKAAIAARQKAVAPPAAQLPQASAAVPQPTTPVMSTAASASAGSSATATPQPVKPPVVQAAPSSDIGLKIAHLAELHAQGVLNDAEFGAAKARLLGL